MDHRYDAFISYRRENGFLMAQIIHDRLKEKGLHCFLDLEEDRSGNFNDNLIAAIDSAPNFILILPKNALNRCVNEDDWVRREIMEALARNKHVIPVMYDGFTWPKSKKWLSAVPQELADLQFQQGVTVRQEYLYATIDKIISYLKDVRAGSAESCGSVVPSKGPDFVRFCMEQKSVQGIDMAFHAGANWHRDDSHLDLLDEMVARKIPVRVLVNEAGAVEQICAHLRRPNKQYTKFQDSIQEWNGLRQKHPDIFQVRVCPLPLMHRMYLVHNRDGLSMANVHYYAYGPYNPSKDSWAVYDSLAPEFRLYADEFEYLWELSKTTEN